MMTIHEVSGITGVSIRALQYYDEIGLLCPVRNADNMYRLYDDAALERLRQILFFRELEFPLKDIKRILDNPSFDRDRVLKQQIDLLEMKKQHLEELISLARRIRASGGYTMDFKAFDTKKMDEYAARAKAEWGKTEAYREYESRNSELTQEQKLSAADGLMAVFAEFGSIKASEPSSDAAQKLVKKLQSYITEHYYTCTDVILAGLGKVYGCGGEFTENIDRAGGDGAALFASEAIRVYCENLNQ